MRCIALAETCLELGLRPVFATEPLTAKDQERLLNRGFQHRPISTWRNQPEALARMRAAALVIDCYDLESNYLKPWAQTERPVLQLVDSGEPLIGATMTLNQNLGAQVPERLGTQQLVGLDYALLRKEFRTAKPSDPSLSPRRCLLSLGAADPYGHMLSLIGALEPVITRYNMILVVVIGANNARAASLHRQAARYSWIELHENVTDMASLMATCQVAVSAAGSTLWELCVMGLPCVVLSIAPNQRPLAQAAADAAVAVDLGRAEDVFPKPLQQALQNLIDDPSARQDQALKGRALVDGQGAVRVAQALKEAL